LNSGVELFGLGGHLKRNLASDVRDEGGIEFYIYFLGFGAARSLFGEVRLQFHCSCCSSCVGIRGFVDSRDIESDLPLSDAQFSIGIIIKGGGHLGGEVLNG
jgi:hypothetical protein